MNRCLVQINTRAKDDTSLRVPMNVIDWRNSSDRKWLESHLHYCMLHDKQVTLSPLGESVR